MGQISSRKVLDPIVLWLVLIGRFTKRGVGLPNRIHGNIPFHSHLLSGNVALFVSVSDLSINLLSVLTQMPFCYRLCIIIIIIIIIIM